MNIRLNWLINSRKVNCWLLNRVGRFSLCSHDSSTQDLLGFSVPCWHYGFLSLQVALPSLFPAPSGLFEFCANLNSSRTPSITWSLIHDLFFWLNCILKVPGLTSLVLMLTATKWPLSHVTILHVCPQKYNVPTVLTQISPVSYYQIW